MRSTSTGWPKTRSACDGPRRVRRSRRSTGNTDASADVLVIADQTVHRRSPESAGGALEVGPKPDRRPRKRLLRTLPVRRTSRRLGLKTEASARFERGRHRCAGRRPRSAPAPFEEIGAGTFRGDVIDRYPAPAERRSVSLRYERVPRLLGEAIPPEEIERIFSGLGFGVETTADGMRLTVPTFRVDVAREADLIEELARHHGYDRLPTTFPLLAEPTSPPDRRIARDALVRRVLVAAGFSEAVTFSFVDEAAVEPFAAVSERVALANPLSAQFAVLRRRYCPASSRRSVTTAGASGATCGCSRSGLA